MRVLIAMATATAMLAGCSAAQPPQPAPGAYRPYYPPHTARSAPAGCPRYGELREAIGAARDRVEPGAQAKLDEAERVAGAACDPRNRAARKKADRALRAVRELDTRAP